MAKYVLIASNPPVSFELEQGFNTIGRNPTNDLRLRDSAVSSFHCEVVLKNESVVVRDLGSTNGTFIEGRRIDQGPLTPGSVLRVGNIDLKLGQRDETQEPRISVPKLPVEAAPSSLMLADGHPACLNHSAVHAAYHCTRCQRFFCADCVRTLGLAGGQSRFFCPACSGPCESLAVPPEAAVRPSRKKKSVLMRLTQTLRLRHKN